MPPPDANESQPPGRRRYHRHHNNPTAISPTAPVTPATHRPTAEHASDGTPTVTAKPLPGSYEPAADRFPGPNGLTTHLNRL
jgi:hypothetical protein